MKIMVVDDQQPIREMMQEVLESRGYEVLTACDGNAALELYRTHRPAFTLTDISMPGMTGLELLRQIKLLNSEASVMLMTGAGSESFAIDALRCGAINYFNKPLDIHDLVETINRYAILAQGYDFEHYAAGFLEREDLKLALTNDLAAVNHAVQMIVNHCRAIFPLEDSYTLRFGLYEMLVNAIEHGNLGISYAEKTSALEQNRLNQLILDRAADPARLDKRVHVHCELDAHGIVCRIEDEGEGFDHSVYSDSSDPAILFERLGASLHGRGIMLTSLQFDDVQWNERGNAVTIVKKVTKNEEVLR